MGNGGELGGVLMLCGGEGREGGNETMRIKGGEGETVAVALLAEGGKVGWRMDTVTRVGSSKPGEMVGRRAGACGDVFAGEPEGVTRFA